MVQKKKGVWAIGSRNKRVTRCRNADKARVLKSEEGSAQGLKEVE